MISIYCDGSSTGRANREGGWCFIILQNNEVLFANYGGSQKTTNNIMELTAIIKGLEKFLTMDTKPQLVEIVSDSEYALKIVNGAYQASKNLDVCNRAKELYAKVPNIRTRWVRGHSGNEWNERCDRLAKTGKEEILTMSCQDFENGA